jgi:hypothetical protein
MDVVRILEGKGRIQLVELASLLLQNPAIGIEEEELGSEACEEDCEDCTEDHECKKCRSRNAIALSEVD